MLTKLWVDGDELLVSESGIGVEDMLRGTDEESSYDQQNAACSHLRCHEELTDDCFVLALARDLKGRGEPEECCSKKGDGSREQQNSPVGSGAEPTRGIGKREEHPHNHIAQSKSG